METGEPQKKVVAYHIFLRDDVPHIPTAHAAIRGIDGISNMRVPNVRVIGEEYFLETADGPMSSAGAMRVSRHSLMLRFLVVDVDQERQDDVVWNVMRTGMVRVMAKGDGLISSSWQRRRRGNRAVAFVMARLAVIAAITVAVTYLLMR